MWCKNFPDLICFSWCTYLKMITRRGRHVVFGPAQCGSESWWTPAPPARRRYLKISRALTQHSKTLCDAILVASGNSVSLSSFLNCSLPWRWPWGTIWRPPFFSSTLSKVIQNVITPAPGPSWCQGVVSFVPGFLTAICELYKVGDGSSNKLDAIGFSDEAKSSNHFPSGSWWMCCIHSGSQFGWSERRMLSTLVRRLSRWVRVRKDCHVRNPSAWKDWMLSLSMLLSSVLVCNYGVYICS